MENNWKILSKETVFENEWRGVDKYVVDLSGGKTDDFFVTTTLDAAMVCAITKTNKVVIIQHYHFLYKKRMYELPAGFVENSDHRKTVEQELLEETGYAAEKFVHLGSSDVERWRVGRMHYYVALGAEKVSEQDLEDSEDIEVELVDIAEFRNMLKENKIENGPSIVGGYMALDYLDKL